MRENNQENKNRHSSQLKIMFSIKFQILPVEKIKYVIKKLEIPITKNVFIEPSSISK
jgi:hypothetical protein